MADGNSPLERLVEILRRITSVPHGPVIDQRFGMNKTILKSKTVDERFQRGARGTQGLSHIDLPRAPGIRIVGRANPRPHLTTRIVYRHDRDRYFRAEHMRAFDREFLQALLQIAVN